MRGLCFENWKGKTLDREIGYKGLSSWGGIERDRNIPGRNEVLWAEEVNAQLRWMDFK
jgi:hypothetical protein